MAVARGTLDNAGRCWFLRAILKLHKSHEKALLLLAEQYFDWPDDVGDEEGQLIREVGNVVLGFQREPFMAQAAKKLAETRRGQRVRYELTKELDQLDVDPAMEFGAAALHR